MSHVDVRDAVIVVGPVVSFGGLGLTGFGFGSGGLGLGRRTLPPRPETSAAATPGCHTSATSCPPAGVEELKNASSISPPPTVTGIRDAPVGTVLTRPIIGGTSSGARCNGPTTCHESLIRTANTASPSEG